MEEAGPAMEAEQQKKRRTAILIDPMPKAPMEMTKRARRKTKPIARGGREEAPKKEEAER